MVLCARLNRRIQFRSLIEHASDECKLKISTLVIELNLVYLFSELRDCVDAEALLRWDRCDLLSYMAHPMLALPNNRTGAQVVAKWKHAKNHVNDLALFYKCKLWLLCALPKSHGFCTRCVMTVNSPRVKLLYEGGSMYLPKSLLERCTLLEETRGRIEDVGRAPLCSESGEMVGTLHGWRREQDENEDRVPGAFPRRVEEGRSDPRTSSQRNSGRSWSSWPRPLIPFPKTMLLSSFAHLADCEMDPGAKNMAWKILCSRHDAPEEALRKPFPPCCLIGKTLSEWLNDEELLAESRRFLLENPN